MMIKRRALISGFCIAMLSSIGIFAKQSLSKKSSKATGASLQSKQEARKNQFVIDKIIVRVNGTNILQSDLETPRIAKEGHLYSIDEAIIEELFVQRAIEQHILPSELDVERQIVSFKAQNGMSDMSDIEFEKQLKQIGFNIKSYKEQLGRLIAVENVKRAEISEKIFITSQEVEAYYKKHPVHVKEAYKLELAHMQTEDANEKDYEWEDLGWIEKTDLAEKFSFVPSMHKGDLSKPMKSGDAYEIIKVVDVRKPRQKTLDECYIDIEKKLHQVKREEFLKNIEKEILSKATIVYC